MILLISIRSSIRGERLERAVRNSIRREAAADELTNVGVTTKYFFDSHFGSGMKFQVEFLIAGFFLFAKVTNRITGGVNDFLAR
jgi:hypothetical protein